ncbi:MAG: BamA/TamA family outer membrane protein, partial [Bacteroidetes bacterium]|nr:BamA/TamA family outer membrane protein [Bacteroidota bacterium]
QDSAFVRQQVGLELEISLDDRWSIGVAVERMAVVPSGGFGTRTVPRNTVVNFGGRLRFDSRDDLVTPTSGFLYETSYRMGTKGTTSVAGASDRFTTQTATMDVAGYYAVAQRHVLAAAIHWGDKRTPTLDVSDLDRVGGASTLRGYREGQFFATRFIWGSFEYRLLAGQRSFLYAFLDGASLAVPGGRILGLSEQADTKFGYGVGIRVDSPVGLIGVSLALGAGDTFSTAKLHIRLINEF